MVAMDKDLAGSVGQSFRRRRALVGLLGIVVGLGAARSWAENWPGFRGPTGQGRSSETNLPRHWTATSNIVWKTELPGQGWSSPVVWGNRVWISATTADGARCHLICFDRDSGKVLWNQQVFEQVPLRKENKNSQATPTPVTDGERVYAVFGGGSIVALSWDGSVLWTNREVSFYSRHGLGASPVLSGDLVIMPFDGSNRVREAGQWPNNSAEEQLGWRTPWDRAEIVALNRRTGRRVWTARRGQSRIAHATPVIYREKGQDRMLSIAGDAVQGFDPSNGKRLWTVYCQGEGVVPTPVVAGDLVVTSSGFEKTTLRGIRLGGNGDVTASHIEWEQKKGVPTQSSLLYVQPLVYAITDGGIATCYEAGSGEIVWQERIGGNHCASPVAADGHLYFLSEAGETTVAKIGREFQIVARNPVGEKCQASMAVSGGRLFLRTEKNLICVGKPR
jgi:outer membrane protein assembly factor BamB